MRGRERLNPPPCVRQGHLLYNAIAELISAHLEAETREKIVPVFPQSANAIASSSAGQAGTSAVASENIAAAAAGQLFLDRIRDVWDDHIVCMGKLRDVLKYLVRQRSRHLGRAG